METSVSEEKDLVLENKKLTSQKFSSVPIKNESRKKGFSIPRHTSFQLKSSHM